MQKYKKPEMLAKDFLVNPLAISLEIPVRDIEFSDSYRSDGEHLMPVIKEVEKTPSKSSTNPEFVIKSFKSV